MLGDISYHKAALQSEGKHSIQYSVFSNVSRLYSPRREGGRGLISVEDAINTEERNINVYISQSKERLLRAA